MLICHGSGDGDPRGGCCYVPDMTVQVQPGEVRSSIVCPLRLRITAGRVYSPNDTDLGTIADVARDRYGVNSGAARRRIEDQLTRTDGRTMFVCEAAIRSIVADPSRLTNRAALDAAWIADAGYVAQVQPAWTWVEQNNGFPAGSYRCSSWGPAAAQCCFAEDQATNDTRRNAMTAAAVQVRSARTG